MDDNKFWDVTIGMGSMNGMENVIGEDEFKRLKGHDVEEVAQLGIHVSQDTGLACGGYEDHQPYCLSLSDFVGGASILVCAIPMGLVSL